MGRYNVQVRILRLSDNGGQGSEIDQGAVQRLITVNLNMWVNENAGRIGLGIGVNQKYLSAFQSQSSRQIDRGGTFGNAPFWLAIEMIMLSGCASHILML